MGCGSSSQSKQTNVSNIHVVPKEESSQWAEKKELPPAVVTVSAPSKPGQAVVVFVLGGPGVGKGTQCARIRDTFGFVHLSAGDLLREEQQNPESQYGKLIKENIEAGKIVPAEITIQLLRKAMEKHMTATVSRRHFLVDGFPRNQDNLEGWNRIVGDFADVRFCLFFSCSEQVMEQRLLKRAESSGRSDDNPETIKKRFKTYVESTVPVIKHFESIGRHHSIDASVSVDQVFTQVYDLFSKQFTQTTYAMIKPDAFASRDSIISEISKNGFTIAASKEFRFSKEQAEQFYGEHKGKSFYDGLISFMTSGSVVGLALRRTDAVVEWRRLAGPTNTQKAKEDAPNSMRARFGTDGTRNAVHGSDAVDSARRELTIVFPERPDLLKA